GRLARVVAAVADREEDYRALVALNVLEVLDEDVVFGVGVEVALDLGVRSPGIVKEVFDQRLLRDAESHDADALAGGVRGLAKPLHDFLDHRLGLTAIRP